MDQELRALEREVGLSPTIDLLRKLAVQSHRAGWTYNGRSLAEHLADVERGWESEPPREWAKDLATVGARRSPALGSFPRHTIAHSNMRRCATGAS